MKDKKVTHKQVCKFTEKFDNQCSDSWLTDILNNEVDIKKLINVIQNLNKYDNINFIFKKSTDIAKWNNEKQIYEQGKKFTNSRQCKKAHGTNLEKYLELCGWSVL